MFVRCKYWRRWSRRLSSNHPAGPFVEINLTPIPSCYSSTWNEDVAPVILRAHGTASEKGDVETDVLPFEVKEAMVSNLGEELTRYLLEYDFLSEIDGKLLLSEMRGGGVPLNKVKKQ